jgi:sorbose reductase
MLIIPFSLWVDLQGIGLAISHQVAQAGAHVGIIYKSAKDAPERAKEISEKYGVHCEAFQCDVSDQAAVGELVGRIYKDVGPVGGVVCNAGPLYTKP